MSDLQTEVLEIIKIPRIWRIQSKENIRNGDISTLVLEVFWRIDWVKASDGVNGPAINFEPGGSVAIHPTPELLGNFSAIADAVYSQIQQSLTPVPSPEEPPAEDI